MYVAVGYALSNSVMLEGPEGLVIVDTTESLDAAKEIQRDFRKISQKPVKAVIYTHHHSDHIYGTEVRLYVPLHGTYLWYTDTTLCTMTWSISVVERRLVTL